ncbi:MAG: recombinase family protein, partial [Hyphomicrobiales bacterium]
DRPELARAIDQLRPGDHLVVTRLDRLARSVADLHSLIALIGAAGAAFRCLQQSGVDTSSSTGKLMLAVLGAVAEFENDIRRERQRDGIEKAKERGAYAGRPATISRAAIATMKAEGLGPTAIAARLKISRASVYRLLSPWPQPLSEEHR